MRKKISAQKVHYPNINTKKYVRKKLMHEKISAQKICTQKTVDKTLSRKKSAQKINWLKIVVIIDKILR